MIEDIVSDLPVVHFLRPAFLKDMHVESFDIDMNPGVIKPDIDAFKRTPIYAVIQPLQIELSATGEIPVGPRARIRKHEKHWKRVIVKVKSLWRKDGRNITWTMPCMHLTAYVEVKDRERGDVKDRVAQVIVKGYRP